MVTGQPERDCPPLPRRCACVFTFEET